MSSNGSQYYPLSYTVNFCYVIPQQGPKKIKPVSGNIKEPYHKTEQSLQPCLQCNYYSFLSQKCTPNVVTATQRTNCSMECLSWLFLVVMFLSFHKCNITVLSEQDWFSCPPNEVLLQYNTLFILLFVVYMGFNGSNCCYLFSVINDLNRSVQVAKSRCFSHARLHFPFCNKCTLQSTQVCLIAWKRALLTLITGQVKLLSCFLQEHIFPGLPFLFFLLIFSLSPPSLPLTQQFFTSLCFL